MPCIRTVLHYLLRPARRAALSGAVAKALVASHLRDTTAIASQLALLFEAAGDHSKAAQYFLAAAQKAADVFAYLESIALARRGLEMLEPLLDSPERVQLELEMQLALGHAMTATKGYVAPEVTQAYAGARTVPARRRPKGELVPCASGCVAVLRRQTGSRGGLRVGRGASRSRPERRRRSARGGRAPLLRRSVGAPRLLR